MKAPLNQLDYREALNKFIDTFFCGVEDIGKNIAVDIPGTMVLDRMKYCADVNIAILWDRDLADRLMLASNRIETDTTLLPIHLYLSLMYNARIDGVSLDEIKLTIGTYTYNVHLMTPEEFKTTKYGLRNLEYRTSMVVGILKYLSVEVLYKPTTENIKAINYYLNLYSFELTRQGEDPSSEIMKLLHFIKEARILMPTLYPEILDTIKFDFSKE